MVEKPAKALVSIALAYVRIADQRQAGLTFRPRILDQFVGDIDMAIPISSP